MPLTDIPKGSGISICIWKIGKFKNISFGNPDLSYCQFSELQQYIARTCNCIPEYVPNVRKIVGDGYRACTFFEFSTCVSYIYTYFDPGMVKRRVTILLPTVETHKSLQKNFQKTVTIWGFFEFSSVDNFRKFPKKSQNVTIYGVTIYGSRLYLLFQNW